MLSQLRTLPSLKGQDRGFTLIELLIVVLIVGILAAVGVPLYLGYVKDAKSVEAKSHVGSLWTSVQSLAIAGCGAAAAVSSGYAKAGLSTGGATADGRWQVGSGGGSTVTVACADGAFTVSASPVFQLNGVATDVAPISVRMTYSSTGTPPAKLECNLGSGFSAC